MSFFATAAEESYSTYELFGDGDLWPSCWAKDDQLYTANGDGTGIQPCCQPVRHGCERDPRSASPVDRTHDSHGCRIELERKELQPQATGMLCIHGDIYLAFQNLSLNFVDTPAASIAKSTDHGKTWTWDKTIPMFGTPHSRIVPLPRVHDNFFLDFGKDSRNAIDGYVYAYGLDRNWRSQQDLYLARVPRGKSRPDGMGILRRDG